MSSGAEMTRRTPVIIDTDPGVDDVLALLLALASPEIEILAIIVCFGNTDIDACYLNVFRVYRTIERHLVVHPEDAPRFPNFGPDKRPILIKGSAAPVNQGDTHYAQYFHGRDGLGGISTRHPEHDVGCDLTAEAERYFRVATSSAADVTINLLRDHSARSITYIALGPMTNLYHTLQQDESTFRSQIGRVVCMGGALDVPGNTSATAEFNWFADPWAVKELLMKPGHGIPLDRFLLLPLDITTPHELPFPIYRTYVDTAFESTAMPSHSEGKPPLRHFTSSFFERTREIMLEFGKDAMELHDPAAVWCAVANPLPINTEDAEPQLSHGWRAVRRVFDIERTGELTRGMCVVDRRMDDGAYEPGANRSLVQDKLEKRAVALTTPALVEVETAADAAMLNSKNAHDSANVGSDASSSIAAGIWCIDRTPGPTALLTVLLERVWGVEGFTP